MVRFTLRIGLGNAAMETAEDVAEALRDVAERLDASGALEPELLADNGWGIHDANGNLVGGWRFERLAPIVDDEGQLEPDYYDAAASVSELEEAGQ